RLMKRHAPYSLIPRLIAAIFTLIRIADTLRSFAPRIASNSMSAPSLHNSPESHPGESRWQRFRFMASQYNELTKPGIIPLLVFATVCPMLVAAGGNPDLALVFCTALDTALICGSANTINMVWDQDIDIIMARTANRPLVTGTITPKQALIFSGI